MRDSTFDLLSLELADDCERTSYNDLDGSEDLDTYANRNRFVVRRT